MGKDRLMRIQLLLCHGAKTLKMKIALAWDAIGEGPALSGLVSYSNGFGCDVELPESNDLGTTNKNNKQGWYSDSPSF